MQLQISVLKDGRGVIVFPSESNITKTIQDFQSGDSDKISIFELALEALDKTLKKD